MRKKKIEQSLVHNGVEKPVSVWAEELGINKQTIIMRIRRGASVAEALTLPVKERATMKQVGDIHVKVKKTRAEKMMTRDEKIMFLSSFTREKHGKFAARNEAICLFIMNTGLRIQEFCGLIVNDVISLSGQFKPRLDVRAEIAKRKKNRQIPLNEAATNALKELIDLKSASFDAPVITLSRRQIQEVVMQASIRAGLGRQLSIHCLRHQFLSEVYSSTKNISTTQTLAGHSSASTTMDIYVHATMDDLTDAVNNLND